MEISITKTERKFQRLKLSTRKKNDKARVDLNQSSRKSYARKANHGSNEMKLARYHRALNKFEKYRYLREGVTLL